MNEIKLIVAGGRDFHDYALLSRVLFALADVELADEAISIVSGMASGADRLGVVFANQHGVKLHTFPADWNKHGKSAGFIRNRQMADFSDRLLAFHDGVSKGTAHMIATMKALNKPVTVISYTAEPIAYDHRYEVNN